MFTVPRIFRSAVASSATRCALFTAVGVTAMSLLAIESHAAESPRQITVNYEGIDLAKGANAVNLYSRLQAAARTVCSEPADGQLSQVQRYRACYANALSQAVAAVDHARVTALFNSDRSMRIAQRSTDSQRRT